MQYERLHEMWYTDYLYVIVWHNTTTTASCYMYDLSVKKNEQE